jgi:arginyl-tRNA synthetase
LVVNFLKEKFLAELKDFIADNLKGPELSDDDFARFFKSIKLEEPKNKEFGDLTTNAAMVLSSVFKKKPMELAEEIKSRLFAGWEILENIEAVNPGFINFNLKDSTIIENLAEIFTEGKDFGKNKSGSGKRIQIEYVSSNPTGNLHIGHGRWGVMGDVLSAVYEANGYDTLREYYVNDYGAQVKIFAGCVKSLYLKKAGLEFAYPADGYPEAMVDIVAEKLFKENGDKFILDVGKILTDDAAIEKNAVEIMLSFIKNTLSSIGVEFDCWFAESSLYENNNFEKTISFLRDKGLSYEKDGALWFKSTNYGDDKDRVIVRSDGNPTYFASDIMYLINKKERGFDFLIYILGADHHGYISRLKAIGKSIGIADDAVNIIIGQLVRLVEGKDVLKMSRRKGRGMTLNDLAEEVGKDAVRYFFSMNSFDTHMDFDVSLAKKKSSANPVFYVQYAHARIESIIRKLNEDVPDNIGVKQLSEIKDPDSRLYPELIEDPTEMEFKNKTERNLAWVLSLFPDVIFDACKNNSPHFLTQYLYRLSTEFHYFYKHNIIIGKNRANIRRLVLVLAAKIVLKNGLSVLGISAPEKM